MTTTKYRFAQPTQFDDNFYDLYSTTNQSSVILTSLREQRNTDNHSPLNNNMQQAPIESLSQQRLQTNSVKKVNNPQHIEQNVRAHPIVEQPSSRKERKGRSSNSDSRGSDVNLTCCCCLSSSHQNQHPSLTDDSKGIRYVCCCCDCHGENDSCLNCGSCSGCKCCDCQVCDHGTCSCGSFDCDDCSCDCSNCGYTFDD
jgi:hypothetical protein